ncbi:MAG TPA: M48 family metalloprotease, partial [Gammaproteobacteria bacterium]
CAGCATNPVTGKQDIVLMSEKDEIAMGEQVNAQVMQGERIYNDVELQNYVQYVGNKLAQKSHRPGLNYRFTVLDSKDVNAFALPGGYIYVTRGLLAYLNSEAELAAVLGHEIGHVTARHAVRQHSATQLTSIGAAIGSAFIPGVGQAGYQLAGVLGEAMLKGYGREHELEADRLGAEYLARTGYDPDAMIAVIGALKSQELLEFRLARDEGREPRVYHGLFASHPDNDTRLQEVVANASKVTPVQNPFLGRNDYMQRVNGLVYGEDTSQGIVKDRDFYHGGLGFAMRFPPAWQIHNLSDRLIAVSPGQDAYLQVTLVRVDPKSSPAEVFSKNMKIERLGSEQALKIHGLPAHTGTTPVNTGVGQRLARITVIQMGGRAFVVQGVTKSPAGFGRYDAAFVDTAQTFRPLTREERQLASKDQRVRVFQANEQTTFENLAKTSPLEKFPEEQIRLINGAYPRGEIRPGEVMKTVQ